MNFYQRYLNQCLEPLQPRAEKDGSLYLNAKLGDWNVQTTPFATQFAYHSQDFVVHYFHPKLNKDDFKGEYNFLTQSSTYSIDTGLKNFSFDQEINENLNIMMNKKELCVRFKKEQELTYLGDGKFDLTISISKRPHVSCSFITPVFETSFSSTDEFFVGSCKASLYPIEMIFGMRSNDHAFPPFLYSSFNFRSDDRWPLMFGSIANFSTPPFGRIFIKNLKVHTPFFLAYFSYSFNLLETVNHEFLLNLNPLSPLSFFVHGDIKFFDVGVKLQVTDKLSISCISDQENFKNNYMIEYDVNTDIGHKSLASTGFFDWLKKYNPFQKENQK